MVTCSKLRTTILSAVLAFAVSLRPLGSAEPPVGQLAAAPAQQDATPQQVPDARSSCAPENHFWSPLKPHERWRRYVRETFASPLILVRTGFPALISHAENEPTQWGRGATGYSRRLADRYGRFVIRQSIEAAGAAVLGHEVRYILSGRSGPGRAANALASVGLTRDSRGRFVPHWARVGGLVASEFTGQTWRPPGYRSQAEAWRNVALRLGVTALFNLAKEFKAEIRRFTLPK